MTEPKKFKKGKHTYTRYGPNFKEVQVEGKPKKEELSTTSTSVSIDMDANIAQGVYSNFTMVHQSDSEVVLDFVFLAPGQQRGRVRSRVILSPKQAQKLSELIQAKPRKT